HGEIGGGAPGVARRLVRLRRPRRQRPRERGPVHEEDGPGARRRPRRRLRVGDGRGAQRRRGRRGGRDRGRPPGRGRRGSRPVKTDVVDRLEAVGAAAWDHLVAQSRLRSPFLTWTWQREWTRTFAADRRLEIRRVEDAEGQLVALLPLHEAAPGVLTLIGGGDISDYLDLIPLAGREGGGGGSSGRPPRRAPCARAAPPTSRTGSATSSTSIAAPEPGRRVSWTSGWRRASDASRRRSSSAAPPGCGSSTRPPDPSRLSSRSSGMTRSASTTRGSTRTGRRCPPAWSCSGT